MITEGQLSELERTLNEFDGPVGGLQVIELINEVRRLKRIESAASERRQAELDHEMSSGSDDHFAVGAAWRREQDAIEELDLLLSGYSEHAEEGALANAARELVATLPKCDYIICHAPATRAWERGSNRYCDEHGPDVPEYPRAKALRALVALLDGGGK